MAAAEQVSRAGRVFGLAATYMGTIVGAGFASGQEIWSFFGRFGWYGLGGLLLSSLFFALAGARAMSLGSLGEAGDTYYQTLQILFGPVASFIDLILLFCLCVLGGVMLAGAGALARMLAWPAWTGIVCTACLGLLVVAFDLPGIVTINKVIVPCLVLLVILVACSSLGNCARVYAPPCRPGRWVPAALLYASYNTVLSLPVLSALGAAERDRRIQICGCVWGATGLYLAGALILAILLHRYTTAARGEVPMAAIAAGLGKRMGLAYSFVLWAEMFTTLVADVYGAAIRLQQLLGGRRIMWGSGVMLAGVLLSKLGFARLVRTAYPALGLVCCGVLIGLLRPLRPRGGRR